MSGVRENIAFLTEQLSDCETQWSLGTFGALAEFTRDTDEPVTIVQDADAISAVTARGGIRIVPRPDLRLIASESTTRTNWSQRVVLCLPEDQCGMSRRRVLTELGPDTDALREQDRDAVLFDLGFAALQVDACIRVADGRVAAELRVLTGRPLFEPDNPTMGLILAASPHRVFLSRIGRIEVFARIPPPNGRSPEGPHTHVLPKLLQRGRTHAATEPIPDGFIPCAHLYPAHPVKDAAGRALAFDARRHDSFQAILRRFGDPDAVALKQRVIAAVHAGDDPRRLRLPEGRFARAGVRIALRQMMAANDAPPALAAWIEQHDHVELAQIGSGDEIHTEVTHAP